MSIKADPYTGKAASHMPVHRFQDHPTTRVYARAGVIVHMGVVYIQPTHSMHYAGGRERRIETARPLFQNFDWTTVRYFCPVTDWIAVGTPNGMFFLTSLVADPGVIR